MSDRPPAARHYRRQPRPPAPAPPFSVAERPTPLSGRRAPSRASAPARAQTVRRRIELPPATAFETRSHARRGVRSRADAPTERRPFLYPGVLWKYADAAGVARWSRALTGPPDASPNPTPLWARRSSCGTRGRFPSAGADTPRAFRSPYGCDRIRVGRDGWFLHGSQPPAHAGFDGFMTRPPRCAGPEAR